jgi:hypothetical protein
VVEAIGRNEEEQLVLESQDMLFGTNPHREIVHPNNSITQIKMARTMKKRAAAISAPCRGPVCKKER